MRLLFPSLLLFFVPCVLGALNNQGRSNKTDALPETAKNVDMHKMMGTWFEMFAHYRNISENCVLYRCELLMNFRSLLQKVYSVDRLYQTHQAVVFSTRKMYRNGFVRDQKLISGPVVSFSSGTVAGFRNTSKLMSLSDRKPCMFLMLTLPSDNLLKKKLFSYFYGALRFFLIIHLNSSLHLHRRSGRNAQRSSSIRLRYRRRRPARQYRHATQTDVRSTNKGCVFFNFKKILNSRIQSEIFIKKCYYGPTIDQ